MNTVHKTNRTFDVITWGALIIWWGITELIPSLPIGVGILGVGLILLGLNLARSLNGLLIGRFSTILGVLALLWGGLELAGFALNLPFEIPVFAIVLIAGGLIYLLVELSGNKNKMNLEV